MYFGIFFSIFAKFSDQCEKQSLKEATRNSNNIVYQI